jgi:hypothetical protein
VSPISRDKAALYPKNWREIRAAILKRARDEDGITRCECRGECGLHRSDSERRRGPRRCEEIHTAPAKWARGKVVLTIAHLNHDPTDNRIDNLKALCQRCHNRYDQPHRQANARATRRRKRDAAYSGRIV